MAPINNKNPFNTKKQTGTVPKTTSTTSSSTSFNGNKASSSTSSTTKNSTQSSSRKNTEIVAPTRRELNDLNNYLLSVTSSSESTKNQNSNCNTKGATGVTNIVSNHLDPTCFELDNLQENQRFCYPVRPIPRRNILNKKQELQENNLTTNFSSGNQQSGNITNSASAAAVGVVIPTTPGSNSAVSQQHQQQHNILPSYISTDLTNNQQQQFLDLNSDLNWEERLNFIQYFLSLTAKPNNKDKMVNDDPVFVNSTSLEDVANSEETSDNRAHSVSSIHTNVSNDQPTIPNYDELQHRLEHSNRNIQNIKDQQQQLLRLQQAAKQHLTDMEDVRNRMPIRYDANNGSAPDYESVEAVHSDMSNLVNRMKNLQLFIQNQNQLSTLLGDDSPDILAEQELLQRKLNELKSHRNEMKSLVNELQDINETAERNIQNNNHENDNDNEDDDNESQKTVGATGNRVVPVDYQRVVPIELIGNSKKPITNGQHNGLVNGRSHEKSTDVNDHHDDDENNDDQMDAETANVIQQKVADINAMKIQLQRLKDMMATVKLIEDKTEEKIPEANINGNSSESLVEEKVTNSTSSSTKRPIEIPMSMQREFSKNFDKLPDNVSTENFSSTNTPKNVATLVEEQAMSERVRLLHEMTADLREQAVGLTSERDRLKAIKEQMKRRNNNNNNQNQLDKNSNIGNEITTRNNINNIQPPIKVDSEKDLLKAEYEAKKKEFEKICQRLQSEEDNNNQEENIENHNTNNDNDDDSEDADDDLKHDSSSANYYSEHWQEQQNQSNSNNNTIERPVILTSCNSSVHEKQSGTINANVQNRGKDSADSGAVDVNGITSLEAGSVQSGSSRSYSMPPPMRSIILNGGGATGGGGNNRDTPWRKNSQDHSNAGGGPGSQHQYMDHNYASLPSMPPPWNAYYYNPYSPHFSYQPPVPAQTNGTAGSDFICPHSSFYSNSGIANNLPSTAGPTNVNDPVLLQQFIQTQQMLINSVCQCNQLLWHQQREINNLNNTVVSLQERLLNAPPDLAQIGASNRGESVPLQNNTNSVFGPNTNRAHSEQPSHRPVPLNLQQQQQQQHFQSNQSPMSPNRYQYHNGYNYGNFYQHHFYQQHQQQRRHNLHNQYTTGGSVSSNAAYNYIMNTGGVEQQIPQNEQQIPPYSQQPRNSSPIPTNVATSSASNNIPQQQNFLNNANDTLNIQSPPTGVAPPIFMHHHNNNIGGIGHHPTHLNNNLNNNSNLLNSQQNCLNTNQTSSNTNVTAGNSNMNNVASAASALNNQVPPGNRANNYWDNFRSYSRQNLLSSNSCKSNEEHNHHQQQQLQLQQLHQQQQHVSQQPHAPQGQFNSSNVTNIYRNHQIAQNYNSNISTASATQSQQPPVNNNNNNTTVINTSNNLNPQNYDHKYFHTFRNEFNTNCDQPQQSTNQINICATSNSGNIAPSGSRDPSNLALSMILSNIQNQHLEVNQGGSASSNLSNNPSDNLNLNENIFDFNNTTSNTSINNNTHINGHRIHDGVSTGSINNNIAAIFGSPDFRNMNFNFGVNDQKKIPINKASCNNTKRLKHTQSASVNNNSNDNSYFIENECSGVAGGSRGTNGIENFNQNNNSLNFHHNGNNNHNNNHHANNSEDIVEGAAGIDETSEEIKRNLLVNALKSDKFTSKFFETLKEDVYRQAYAIIQEKKSDQQFLAQLFEELKGAAIYDPLRNLLVHSNNIKTKTTGNNRSFNDTESNDGDNEMENYDHDDNNRNLFNNLPSSRIQPTLHSGYENIDNSIWSTTTPRDCSLSSNNENRNTTINETIMENIRDNDLMTSLLNSKDMKMLAYKFMMGGNTIDQHHKNKLQDKNGDINQAGSDLHHSNDGARGLPISSTSCTYRPDIYIVNYVMRRIRKEFHSNCIIDDQIMIRIAKSTIRLIQDAILILGDQKKSIKIDNLEITPKEIYTNMKTFNKRDQEHFLIDYQNYLMQIINENGNVNLAKSSLSSSRQYQQYSSDNSLLQISNRVNNRCSNEQQSANRNSTNNNNIPLWTDNVQQNIFRHCDDVNGFKSNILPCSSDIKVENVIESHQQQQRAVTLSNNTNSTAHDIGSPSTSNSNNNIMNEDLAEADQICSSNSNLTNGLNEISDRNTFSLPGVNNSNPCTEEQLNTIDPPQRNHSLEVEEFFEHDILGDNASMNEEDQDDAEEAAAAAAVGEIINTTSSSTTLNIESFNGRNNMARIYSNSIIGLQTENKENLLNDQQKKYSSNLSNNTDCCGDASGNNTNGGYALVYPINNNLMESTENSVNMIQNNNFDIVTRVTHQPQSDSNCSSPSNLSTTTKKTSKSSKRNSVP